MARHFGDGPSGVGEGGKEEGEEEGAGEHSGGREGIRIPKEGFYAVRMFAIGGGD